MYVVTTSGDHGLNYITRVGIASVGANYGDGSGSVQTSIMQNWLDLLVLQLKYVTANVEIDATGAISDIKIVDGGSAYGIGNTLAVTGIGTTVGHIVGHVIVEQIHNSIGDVLRIDGIRDDRFKDYNNLYRITSVGTGDDVNINGICKHFTIRSICCSFGNHWY